MGKIKNVLFACYGNTARSITAQGIADLLKATKFKKELNNVNLYSADFINAAMLGLLALVSKSFHSG